LLSRNGTKLDIGMSSYTMIKLLICLLSAAALAACVLQLRQQRLELGYQNAELHEQIRSHQSRLWDQQLQIATFTAPNAIANTVNAHDLKMVPRQQPLAAPNQTGAKPPAKPATPTKPAQTTARRRSDH
jgi:hypothetical protein